MALSDTSDARLSYVAESVWGTTPATPSFQNMRFTGETLIHDKTTAVSDEIRPDAEVSDLIQLATAANGPINFELSHGSEFDTMFAHFLRTTAVQVTTGTFTGDVGSTSTFTRSTGNFLADGFKAGQSITTTGYTDAANNGTFTIASVSNDGLTITTVETTLVVESGGGDENIDVAGTTLYAGGIEKKSLTWERTLEGGATDAYFRFTGMRANQLDLDFTTNSIVTGSMSWVGQHQEAIATSAIAGSSYADPNSNDILSGVQGAVVEVAGATSAVFVQSLTLSVNNNLAPRQAIGNLPAIDVRYGRREVTGTFSIYFDPAAGGKEVYDLFRAHTEGAMRWSVSDAAGNDYTFHLPKIKYATAQAPASANNEDAIISGTFQALVEPTDFATSIQIIA